MCDLAANSKGQGRFFLRCCFSSWFRWLFLMLGLASKAYKGWCCFYFLLNFWSKSFLLVSAFRIFLFLLKYFCLSFDTAFLLMFVVCEGGFGMVWVVVRVVFLLFVARCLFFRRLWKMILGSGRWIVWFAGVCLAQFNWLRRIRIPVKQIS